MRGIEIEHDDKQQFFVIHFSHEFQPREHNSDILMTYEQSQYLYAKLGSLLKEYEKANGIIARPTPDGKP